MKNRKMKEVIILEIMDVLRQEMGTFNIPVKELARRINVAANTVSTWFNRGTIPADMMGRVVGAVDSPRLSEMRCSRCEGNAFPTRYLDNVDDHPMVAIDKAIEEADEWQPLAKQVRLVLVNKRRGTKFTEAEEAILKRFEDETADIITATKTILIRFQECYSRPVRDTMDRHVDKLERSGYCTQTDKRKNACAGTQTL